MKLKAWLGAAALAGAALCFSTSQASAQVEMKTLPAGAAGGTTYIGVIGVDTWAGTQISNGTCLWTKIATGGGMLHNEVVLNGTSGVDTINAFTWDVPLCGFTMHPLVSNGFFLRIYSGAGNDRLENYTAKLQLNAEGGSDVVVNWNGYADGGENNDSIWGDTDDILVGGNGNDKINVINGEWAYSAIGGNGDDTLCGKATIVTVEHHFPNCIP